MGKISSLEKSGIFLVVIAFVYLFGAGHVHGWSWVPTSIPEAIVELIGAEIFLTGIVLSSV